MDREKWLQERRKGIGGSDIAGIVGESPWATPLSVFMDKLGFSEPQPETPQQKRGKLLEHYVARMYEQETRLDLATEGATYSKSNVILRGNPDRVVYNPDTGTSLKGLEIKTHRNDKGYGEPGTDQIPLYEALQCHWYLILFPDFQEWDLAALLGIDDFRIYTIKRDVELEGLLVERAMKFWRDHIETGIPPDLTRANPYQVKDYLKAKYQSHDSEMIQVNSEINGIFLDLEDQDHLLESAKMNSENLKNRLKNLIGNHAGVESQEFKATWKQTKPIEKIDWEKIARELKAPEDLIKRFTTKKPGPRKFLWSHKQQEIEHDGSRRQITSKSE